MNNKFEISMQYAQPVLSIRKFTRVQDLPQELGKVYAQIIEYLDSIGEKPAEAAFTAYYNMDMQNLDVEMGFTVSKSIPGSGEITAGEIPAGKQASCLYKGPYKNMEPVYDEMSRWMADNGHIPTGICYELYYNGPSQVPESEFLTKIVFPLK